MLSQSEQLIGSTFSTEKASNKLEFSVKLIIIELIKSGIVKLINFEDF